MRWFHAALLTLSASLVVHTTSVSQQHAAALPPSSGDTLLVCVVPMDSIAARPFSHVRLPEQRRPRLGLVFSGGGARGIAQVGVLRALVEGGIEPDFIVGTSIGSIVGGLHAAGYTPEQLEQTVRTIDWDDLLRLSNQGERANLLVDQKPVSDRSIFTLRFDGLRPILPVAVSNGQRMTNLLNELTLQARYHAADFDSLRIPFRAVATDLYSGRRIVLAHGNLAEALRASATVPVLFAPVLRDSLALVDGGLHANVPVDVAREAGCDVVYAVNTTSPSRTREQIGNPVETLDQMLNILMEQSSLPQLGNADLVITPDLGTRLSSDFSQIDTLLSIGYAAGRSMLPRLRSHYDSACLAYLRTGGYVLTPGSSGGIGVPDSTAPLSPAPVRCTFAVSVDDEQWMRMPRTRDEVAARVQLLLASDRFSSMRVLRVGRSGASSHWLLDGELRPRIRTITTEGNTAFDDEQFAPLLRKWIGQPASRSTLRGIAEETLSLYRTAGYSLARVRNVDYESSTGSVALQLTEGHVDDVLLEGNTRTNEVVILREFPLSRGSLFRIENVRRGLANITALNLFHQVGFDVEEGNPSARIRIRVEERPSQVLQGILRIDDERNAQFGADLRDANLFGTGTVLNFSFFGGIRNRSYTLAYSTSTLFYTPLSLRVAGYYDLCDYNAFADFDAASSRRTVRDVVGTYRRIVYGGTATAGMYVSKIGDLHAVLRAEQHELRTLTEEPDRPLGISERHRIVSLGLGTTIDTQDRFPYPTRGMYFTAAYTAAQERLGSDVSFTRFETEYLFYVSTPGRDWSLRPRMRFGYGDRTMPQSEEFRLGGQHSFLGMRENEYTGRQLFSAELQIRYTLPFKILVDTYASAHYGIGRTWENSEQIKASTFLHGYGFSLGFDTPIGPADFSIGQTLEFRSGASGLRTRARPLNAYFSIGIGM